MEAKIQKWGNSLAIRIPKSFVKETDISHGSVVNLSMEKGKLVIDPSPAKQYDLEDLLEKVTSKNIHNEVSTGKRVGKEVW